MKKVLHGSVSVNQTTLAGETALHIAAFYGKVEVIRLLARHPDIDVNIFGKTGGTPLHICAHQGHAAAAATMLSLAM